MPRVLVVLFILPLLIFPPYLTQASGNSIRKGLYELQDESEVIVETQEKGSESSSIIAEISGPDESL